MLVIKFFISMAERKAEINFLFISCCERVDISDEVSQKMAKESFKVGDKVIPKNPERWAQGNNIGKVISIEPKPWIIVEWKWNGTSQKNAYYQEEIRYVNQKGQQMLFDFMSEK